MYYSFFYLIFSFSYGMFPIHHFILICKETVVILKTVGNIDWKIKQIGQWHKKIKEQIKHSNAQILAITLNYFCKMGLNLQRKDLFTTCFFQSYQNGHEYSQLEFVTSKLRSIQEIKCNNQTDIWLNIFINIDLIYIFSSI